MSLDPWYLLKCSTCRSTLRIKSEYVHMKGQCPVCHARISAPVPKPLSFSDDADSIREEPWPEPALVVTERGEEGATSYAVKSQGAEVAAQQPVQEEEPIGGVYTLAFDADAPKEPGVIRSAEWDQGNAPPSPAKPAAPVMQATSAAPAQPAPVIAPAAFKVEVDPLFGDEVKVAVASKAPATAPPKPTIPEGKAIPVARLATAQDLKPKPKLEPAPELPPEPPALLKKKSKKKANDEPASETPSESIAHLNQPTEETHLYRLSNAEVNRIKPDAPPSSLFIDGVLGFPWQLNNLGPWIWLTLYFSFIFLLLWMIQYILDSGSTYAVVGAAGFGMAVFFVSVFALAYGCACWSNTINYTAAGSRAVEWHSEGWRENVMFFLIIGYHFALALIMATPLLIFNFIGIGTYLWLMGALFIFPVFLFSGMASLTFWNFLHGEVIKNFIKKMPYYLVMYGMGVALFAVAGVAVYFTMHYAWLFVISGPLFAAAWMIYGRLLGRMAYLLQQQPKKKKKKKKKKVAEEAASDEEVEEEGEAETNEKGPREDARGPGGARPV